MSFEFYPNYNTFCYGQLPWFFGFAGRHKMLETFDMGVDYNSNEANYELCLSILIWYMAYLKTCFKITFFYISHFE